MNDKNKKTKEILDEINKELDNNINNEESSKNLPSGFKETIIKLWKNEKIDFSDFIKDLENFDGEKHPDVLPMTKFFHNKKIEDINHASLQIMFKQKGGRIPDGVPDDFTKKFLDGKTDEELIHVYNIFNIISQEAPLSLPTHKKAWNLMMMAKEAGITDEVLKKLKKMRESK